MDLLDAALELVELLPQAIAVAAPIHVLADGARLNGGAGHDLIARVQHVVLIVLGDVHFALDDRNARAFHAGDHAEDGPGDGYLTIGRGDVEMTLAALGCLNNDAAAVEPDGAIGRAGGSGEA